MSAALGLLAPVVVLALLERWPRLRFRPSRLLRPYVGSDVVYLLTGYLAAGAFSLAWVAAADAALVRAGVPRLAAAAPPWWVAVALALVALDAGNYLAHWLLHRVDTLWAFHEVHHSSPALDALATFRSHLVEQAVRRLVAPGLVIVLGVPLDAVVVAAGVFTAWATLNHANLDVRLGPLERVLITPARHRAHHAPPTTERNLGTVLTIWDAWRGTLVAATPGPDEPLGVPGEVATYPQGWLRQLVEPLRRLARGRLPAPAGQCTVPPGSSSPAAEASAPKAASVA